MNPRAPGKGGLKVLVTGFDWYGDLVPFVVRALTQLNVSSEVVWTSRDTIIHALAERLKALERLRAAGCSTR